MRCRLLASSGNFDGDGETSEAKNLIGFGRGLGGEALSPALGGIERSALFDKPRTLFIIVYLQSLPRRCAMDSAACLVDGRKPTDIFLETDAIGRGGLAQLRRTRASSRGRSFTSPSRPPKGRASTRSGPAAGRSPAFRRTLFDVMAPSQNAYFGPLTDALNAAHRGTGSMGDFCELIGDSPEAAIKRLGNSVAGVLGPHYREAATSDAPSSDLPPWLRRAGAAPRGTKRRAAATAALGAGGVRRGRGRRLPVRAPGRRRSRRHPRRAPVCPPAVVCPPPPAPHGAAHARLAPSSKRSKPAPAALSPLPDRSPLDEGARKQALLAFAEKKAPELRDCVAEPDRGPTLKLGAAFEIGSDGAVDFVQILGADGSPKTSSGATPTG